MTKSLLIVAALAAFGAAACDPGSGGGAAGNTPASPAPLDETPPTPVGPDHLPAAPGAPVSVRLTVRVSRAGSAEIVDAVELPGLLKQEQDLTRDYLYEARDALGVIAVRGVDIDFEERPFGAGRQHGELRPLDTELIHVDLPGVSLERARQVTFNLSRVVTALGEKVATPTSFSRLSAAGKLAPFAALRPAQLDAAVRTLGRRAPTVPSPTLTK